MDVVELYQRRAPIEIAPEDFRKVGYQVVDQLANFLECLPQLPVTTGETPTHIRKILGENSLPDEGDSLESLLDETTRLLVNHSLFNGHPRFWGYITSSAAPIGALAYWNRYRHPYIWKKRAQEQLPVLGGFGIRLQSDILAI
ncbi:MAG TPA: hypothetical protein VIS10_01930 [Anaerolineales bacterium]